MNSRFGGEGGNEMDLDFSQLAKPARHVIIIMILASARKRFLPRAADTFTNSQRVEARPIISATLTLTHNGRVMVWTVQDPLTVAELTIHYPEAKRILDAAAQPVHSLIDVRHLHSIPMGRPPGAADLDLGAPDERDRDRGGCCAATTRHARDCLQISTLQPCPVFCDARRSDPLPTNPDRRRAARCRQTSNSQCFDLIVKRHIVISGRACPQPE